MCIRDRAWIDVRPDNVTHVVSAGDSFKIDRKKWVVKSVSVNEGLVVFDVENEIKTFRFPSFLNQALEDEESSSKKRGSSRSRSSSRDRSSRLPNAGQANTDEVSNRRRPKVGPATPPDVPQPDSSELGK